MVVFLPLVVRGKEFSPLLRNMYMYDVVTLDLYIPLSLMHEHTDQGDSGSIVPMLAYVRSISAPPITAEYAVR